MKWRKEVAEKSLQKYDIKHGATFRGIPVSEFDREELLKIIDMYAGLLKDKDKTISCLSRV